MKKEIMYNKEVRFKQAHLNYFATKWKRLDVRGKSSKELKDIINELQKANRYLLRSIKALDYKENEARKAGTAAKQSQKQADKKLITRARRSERIIAKEKAKKLVVEAKSILQSKISDLYANIRHLRNRIAKGLLRERSLRAEIRDLKKQLEAKPSKELASQYFIDLANEYKDKYDKEKLRANKNLMRKQRRKTIRIKVPVQVEKPRTSEEIRALKLLKYVEQPVDKKISSTVDIATRSLSFILESDLDIKELDILFRGSLLPMFSSKDVGHSSRIFVRLQQKGYLSRDKTGLNNASHYWFLTPEGFEIVDKFRKTLYNGKTKL